MMMKWAPRRIGTFYLCRSLLSPIERNSIRKIDSFAYRYRYSSLVVIENSFTVLSKQRLIGVASREISTTNTTSAPAARIIEYEPKIFSNNRIFQPWRKILATLATIALAAATIARNNDKKTITAADNSNSNNIIEQKGDDDIVCKNKQEQDNNDEIMNTKRRKGYLPSLWSLLTSTLFNQQEKEKEEQNAFLVSSSSSSSPSVWNDSLAPRSPIRVFRPNPNLEIAFDVRTRNPLYVMERLTPANILGHPDEKGQGKRRRRRPNFYEDRRLTKAFRSRNSYYHLSGYDRGHMAPAADFTEDGSSSALVDTYNLCNVSPQNEKMNRTVWCDIERWIRTVIVREIGDEEKEEQNSLSSTNSKSKKTAYVVTGPLWMVVPEDTHPDSAQKGSSLPMNPSSRKTDTKKIYHYHYNAIGSHPPLLVSVPTHFFKVVVIVVPNDKEAQNNYIDAVATQNMKVYNNVNNAYEKSNESYDSVSTMVALRGTEDLLSSQEEDTARLKSERIESFACFVVPNEAPSSQHKKQQHQIEDYMVRWTDLEIVSGLELFPGIVPNNKNWKEQADALAHEQINIKSTTRGGNPNQVTKKSQKRKKLSKQHDVGDLHHLCTNGRCH